MWWLGDGRLAKTENNVNSVFYQDILRENSWSSVHDLRLYLDSDPEYKIKFTSDGSKETN